MQIRRTPGPDDGGSCSGPEGSVHHKKSGKANKGRVISQSPAPGKKLKHGSKIAVTLGK